MSGLDSGNLGASDPARRLRYGIRAVNPAKHTIKGGLREDKENKKGSVGYCTCYRVESMLRVLGRHQVETGKE